jgi:drug/metabolite transporter (DMT)-like permease
VTEQKKAVLYAACAVGLWSTVATAFKIALRYMSPLHLLFLSSFVSFAAFFSILLVRGKLRGLLRCSGRELAKSAGMGFLNPFLYYLVLFQAYSRLLGQEALVLNYTWPIVLVLFSVFLLKQRISLKGMAALLLSFLGVVVIATRGSFASLRFSDPLGMGLALGSSLVWALFWLMNVKDKREAVLKLCLNFFFGTLYSAAALLIFEKLSLPALSGCLAVVYVGLFEMGVTFLLWMQALKLAATTALISNLVFLSPFASLLLLHLIIGEDIFLSTFLGLALIVAGIVLQRYTRKKMREAAPGPGPDAGPGPGTD